MRKRSRPHSHWASYRWHMLPKISLLAWTCIFVVGTVTASFYYRNDPLPAGWPIAIIGTLLAAVFQIASAYHAQVSHFLECFNRCTTTYSELNGKLPGQTDSDDEDRTAKDDVVIDYFNLCAEEHLMHKMGVIPEFVWQEWCEGMHECVMKGALKPWWDKEAKDGCEYYGFDLAEVMRLHHLRHPQCDRRDSCPWNQKAAD